MRQSREKILHPDSGEIHQYWKCHNSDYYLKDDSTKALYLTCLKKKIELPCFKERVTLSAYCVMDNHFHSGMSYYKGSRAVSKLMQKTHTSFCLRYNRINNRSGSVLNDRPKTPLIQDESHAIRAHLYIEANPVRAKKCSINELKYYKFSTYRFYAFGIKDEFTSMITIPRWYINLGNSPSSRQRKYRRLFFEYIDDLIRWFKRFSLEPFLGASHWVEKQKERLRPITDVNSKSLGSSADDEGFP